jgi:hypothetical protein
VRWNKGSPSAGIFNGLSGLLQVIISQNRAGKAKRGRFLLCWLGESLAGAGILSSPAPLCGASRGGCMQQPHLREVTIYADITEVRMETWAADCKKLLADGWVLLEVYPLTTVGEPAHGKSRRGQTKQQPQDAQLLTGSASHNFNKSRGSLLKGHHLILSTPSSTKKREVKGYNSTGRRYIVSPRCSR